MQFALKDATGCSTMDGMTISIDLPVNWRDIDGLGHMANTAYLDKGADARRDILAEHGLPVTEFFKRGIPPFMMRDEIEYRRESVWGQTVNVAWEIVAESDDHSHFTWQHDFTRDGKFLARVKCTGGWFDMATRSMSLPIPGFAEFSDRIRTPDCAVLPSLLK